MSSENSLKDELLKDEEALSRSMEIINRSTFKGNGAPKIAITLEVLKELHGSVIANLRQENSRIEE